VNGVLPCHAGVTSAQLVVKAPSIVMIGARSVAADADAAHDDFTLAVKCEATAEHVHASNFVSHHGVVSIAIVTGRPLIRHTGIDWITFLQAKQAPPG